jgi:hypothetical protein
MLRAWARIVCGAQDDSKELRDEPVNLSDLEARRQHVSPAPRGASHPRAISGVRLDQVEWSDERANVSMKVCNPDG